MTNKIKKEKLWLVTFYNADDDKDWEIVVASSYDIAVKTAKKVIRDQVGLEKGEKLECTDFEAFLIQDECDLNSKIYQINLEIKKEK
ncbi:MAG: hypothetical protein WCX73_06090 [Candidatus Pacearchaeota archaeon]